MNKGAGIAGKVAYGMLHQFVTLPQRAIDASAADVQHLGEYGYTPQSIGPAVETGLLITGLRGPLSGPSNLAMGAAPAAAESVGLGRMLPTAAARVAESPEILPEEVAGRTRSEIRDLAADKGLVPKGDPLHPDYPRRWSDPVTNKRRLRLDRGHVTKTGQPYDMENAAVDHVHAYDVNDGPIEIDNDPHIPTTGE